MRSWEERRVESFMREVRVYSLPVCVVNGLLMMDSSKSIISVSVTCVMGESSSSSLMGVSRIMASPNSPMTQTAA